MKTLLKLTALCFAFALAATPVVVHAQDKTPAKTEKAAKPKPPAKVDINTASAEQLKKLSGIDAETANKIIAGRPYDNKAQLKSKNIISEAVYNKITDQIIAKQPKTDGNAPKGEAKSKGKDAGSKSKDKAAK